MVGHYYYFLSQHLVEMSILVFRFCNFVFVCNLQELWDEVVFFSVNVYVYAAINIGVDHFLNPPLFPPPSTTTHRFNSSSIQHFNFLCTPSTTTHCSSIVDAMRIYLGKLQRCLFSYVTSSFFYLISFLFTSFSLCFHLHIISTR